MNDIDFHFSTGSSKNMPFDAGFALGPSQMKSNDFTFNGYQSTKIRLNYETNIWSIEISQNSNKTAITESTLPPFGTHKYSLSQSLGGGHILLNIDACDESKHFNCKDGSCIDSEKRCDSKIDCFDASDESECQKILVGTNYLKYIPGKINYPLNGVVFMKLILIFSSIEGSRQNADKTGFGNLGCLSYF